MKKKRKSEFRKIWDFVVESKIYFFVAIVFFIISILGGFIFPVFFVDYIKKVMEQLAAQTAGLNFIQLFIFIFSNNIKTAFLGLFSGILFGVIPFIILLFNGYILGFVGNKVVISSGFLVLWRLLPHGIFEIPALILSLGLGLRLGMFIFRRRGKKMKELIHSLTNSIRVFVYFIIPLLITAAIIETALIIFLK